MLEMPFDGLRLCTVDAAWSILLQSNGGSICSVWDVHVWLQISICSVWDVHVWLQISMCSVWDVHVWLQISICSVWDVHVWLQISCVALQGRRGEGEHPRHSHIGLLSNAQALRSLLGMLLRVLLLHFGQTPLPVAHPGVLPAAAGSCYGSHTASMPTRPQTSCHSRANYCALHNHHHFCILRPCHSVNTHELCLAVQSRE